VCKQPKREHIVCPEDLEDVSDNTKSMTDHIARVSPDAFFVLVLLNKSEEGNGSIAIGANLDKQGIAMVLTEAMRQVIIETPLFENLEKAH
jgi:hypothetical protein